MVKRWIIMIVIFVALVVGGIIETTYTQNTFKWLVNSLEAYEIELIENKAKVDEQKLIEKIYNIDNEWNKRVKGLKCLVWHSGVKDIEVGLARVAVYVEENNFTEAYAETAALIDYSVHCLDDFMITIENIL